MTQNQRHNLYHLQSDAVYLYTGQMKNTDQCLIGVLFPEIVLLQFDCQGNFLKLISQPIPQPPLLIKNGTYECDRKILSLLIEQYQTKMGITPIPIKVKSFFLTDRYIGIKALPDHYQEVLDHPEEYDPESLKVLKKEIDLWLIRGDFVLYWAEEYYMNKEGEIVST